VTQFLYDGLDPLQELQAGAPSANTLTGLGIDEYFQRADASDTNPFQFTGRENDATGLYF